MTALPIIRRDELPPGDVLCSYCTARCCRYIALPLEKPTSWVEFDHMRWFLIHGKNSIFVDDGTWFLLVGGDCNHLNGRLCGIYETRPQICRDYSTDNCEYGDEGSYDKYFETAEQIWEYAEAVLPPSERDAVNALGLPRLRGGVAATQVGP